MSSLVMTLQPFFLEISTSSSSNFLSDQDLAAWSICFFVTDLPEYLSDSPAFFRASAQLPNLLSTVELETFE